MPYDRGIYDTFPRCCVEFHLFKTECSDRFVTCLSRKSQNLWTPATTTAKIGLLRLQLCNVMCVCVCVRVGVRVCVLVSIDVYGNTTCVLNRFIVFTHCNKIQFRYVAGENSNKEVQDNAI